MLIKVSIGEVVDRITILEIKKERIRDSRKLSDICAELDALQKALSDELLLHSLFLPESLKQRLKSINQRLWDAEDVLREKEASHIYDEEFIQNAVLDSELNDERFLAKNEINVYCLSSLKEHKSYDHLEYET